MLAGGVIFSRGEPDGGGGIYITKGIRSTSDLDSFPISGLIIAEVCSGCRPTQMRNMFQNSCRPVKT